MFRFCVNRTNLVINNDIVTGTVRIIYYYYFSMSCCLPMIWGISLVLSPVQAAQGLMQPGLGHLQGTASPCVKLLLPLIEVLMPSELC